MAISCPTDFDAKALREEVSKIYSRVATDPEGDFYFQRGPDYASSMLGYDRERVTGLPEQTTASFAGVANPLAIDEVGPGQQVFPVSRSRTFRRPIPRDTLWGLEPRGESRHEQGTEAIH